MRSENTLAMRSPAELGYCMPGEWAPHHAGIAI